jgi:hypothetical protein
VAGERLSEWIAGALLGSLWRWLTWRCAGSRRLRVQDHTQNIVGHAAMLPDYCFRRQCFGSIPRMETIIVDDGMVPIQIAKPNGEIIAEWSMDLLGTYRRVSAERAKVADGDPYAYLDLFKRMVKENKGPDLNDTQADRLFDELMALYLQKKSERASAMLSGQMSPSSTASTPSE